MFCIWWLANAYRVCGNKSVLAMCVSRCLQLGSNAPLAEHCPNDFSKLQVGSRPDGGGRREGRDLFCFTKANAETAWGAAFTYKFHEAPVWKPFAFCGCWCLFLVVATAPFTGGGASSKDLINFRLRELACWWSSIVQHSCLESWSFGCASCGSSLRNVLCEVSIPDMDLPRKQSA